MDLLPHHLVYFWPDIEKIFLGVRCILADRGTSLLVNEDDGLSGNNGTWEKIIDGMHTYTPDELKTHLTAAGFRNVTINRDEGWHWLAATASSNEENLRTSSAVTPSFSGNCRKRRRRTQGQEI